MDCNADFILPIALIECSNSQLTTDHVQTICSNAVTVGQRDELGRFTAASLWGDDSLSFTMCGFAQVNLY